MEDLRIEDAEIENADPPWFKLRAVAVHLYTASGAVLALLMLVAAFQGEAGKALWVMLAALVIDSTDGLLARLRVNEALPFFDGSRKPVSTVGKGVTSEKGKYFNIVL